MSERPPSEVLGALPRSRPHRRSAKRPALPVDDAAPEPAPRAAKAAAPKAKATTKRAAPKPKPKVGDGRSAPLSQPAQPDGTPQARRTKQPERPDRHDILGTAVQAAAEIAEIGLSASARAIRRAVSRLPRP
jgi:hypothetical protein